MIRTSYHGSEFERVESLRQTSDYSFPLMVIERSEVLCGGRDESHVLPDLVKFSVALRLRCVRRLERMDLQSRLRIQCEIPAKVIDMDRVFCVVLFEVIPYYLKWLDRMCVLFTVSHRKNGKHRGFIQNERDLVVLIRPHHFELDELSFEPYPACLRPYTDIIVGVYHLQEFMEPRSRALSGRKRSGLSGLVSSIV